MDYLECDRQSLEGNNLEEIISILPNEEEGSEHYMFGSDGEETINCEEGDAQIPKENDAEAPNNASSAESNIKNPNENDNEDEDVEIPKIGLRFSNEDKAYNFYNAYAANIGFSIRRDSIRRNQNGVVCQRTFVCSKEGLKLDSYGEQQDNKLETRTDCKAYIRFTVIDGMWEVTRFDPDHNHELAKPEQKKYLRSARKLFEASPIPVYSESAASSGTIKVPSVGMKVYSENEAYNLYNLYATDIGFSIRKGAYRFNSRGELRQRNYVCSKQGLRVDDELDRERKVNRLETRTDCKASIRFTITDNVWEITFFNPDHNHELVEPEQRKHLRSIRRISPYNASLLTSTSTTGRRTIEVGVVDNGRFDTKRPRIIEAGDAQNVINRLKYKLAEDALFFYSVKVDSHSRLSNFFWRDGRSKLDFDYFGDVVVLDTSFRTYSYNFVCASFVGINHHGKNILLGCAILSEESESSFCWLLETFLESMGHRQPKTIFTDQNQSLAYAIENVLPRTAHRLCIWNIQANAALHLPNLYSNPEFKAKFDKCLNGCRTEIEFQSTWDELIKGHSENEWLNKLYNLRMMWCPIFGVGTFSANARSTQMNAFNHRSCKTMNLVQLVDHYEEIAERLRLKELEEDLRCNQDLPTRASRNSAMLKQAADVYTIEIFILFQEEMVESLSIVMNELSSDGRLHTFELIGEGHNEGYIVHFNADNCTATCNCKMFESMGLLCRHVLRVLNLKNVTKLPARYILKRWTKGARKGIAFSEDGESSSCSAKQNRSLLRSKLMYKAFCAVDKSLQTTKGSDIADTLLDQIIEQAENVSDIDNGDNESRSNNSPCSFDSSPVLDSSHTRPKSDQQKRKRKDSKSKISAGQKKLPIPIASSSPLFQPQFPAFYRPPFHPPMLNTIPYALHQEHPPTWFLGNMRPASVLSGTELRPQANQGSDANHREMTQLHQGNRPS